MYLKVAPRALTPAPPPPMAADCCGTLPRGGVEIGAGNVATPGAEQRSQPGSGLDELRRVLRRSRRRACTVRCWRSRARRSRGRRSAGAAVAVQEAIRMGGTGPLQRSCEATSRRAPPATFPIGERTDSFVPATEEPFLLKSTGTPATVLGAREARHHGRPPPDRHAEGALSHAPTAYPTPVPILPEPDGPPGRDVLALRHPVGV
jgi:hypothetical protein